MTPIVLLPPYLVHLNRQVPVKDTAAASLVRWKDAHSHGERDILHESAMLCIESSELPLHRIALVVVKELLLVFLGVGHSLEHGRESGAPCLELLCACRYFSQMGLHAAPSFPFLGRQEEKAEPTTLNFGEKILSQ